MGSQGRVAPDVGDPRHVPEREPSLTGIDREPEIPNVAVGDGELWG